MYTLNEETEISKKDIKTIAYHEGTLAIAGRNEEITLLNKDTKRTISPRSSYINTCTFTTIKDNLALIIGCQNGAIIIYTNILSEPKPLYLLGHKQNVCSLDVYENILVSGSWDGNIKVWDLNSLKEIRNVCVGCCVWAVKFYDGYDFIAACADKNIRVYKNYEVSKMLVCNLSAVRGIALNKEFVFSIGNDGKIMKMDLHGRLYKVCDVKDFLYSVCICDDKSLVCGENGKVLLLDLDLQILWESKIVAQSCWTGIFVDGEILACGSNGILYKFRKQNDNEIADENEKKNVNNKEVKDNEDTKEKNSGMIPKDSNYKIDNGKVYMFENNEWNLIGEVDDNEKFDYSFDVEVEGKYLKINFNEGDDIFEVADKFILKNSLKKEYRDDIVEFIQQNFKPKENYFIYKDINVNGIEKYLKDELILENLRNPNKENNMEIGLRLRKLVDEKENFYILDCYRFFVANGWEFDFTFLQDYKVDEKKNATVFMRLLVNLYRNQPFNLEVFKGKVGKITDYKLVDENTMDKFKKNKELSNK